MARHAASDNAAITDRLIDIASGHERSCSLADDRRLKKRFPYEAFVSMVIADAKGQVGKPMIVRARDISMSGICVTARQMMFPGAEGAMQLVRSNGELALVGIKVQHCRYAGEMRHHTGIKFRPLPPSISARHFLDNRGRMLLLRDAESAADGGG